MLRRQQHDLHRVGCPGRGRLWPHRALSALGRPITWLRRYGLRASAATALIIAMRRRARPQEVRDWRLIWALALLAAFERHAVSYLLGPVDCKRRT